MREMSSGTRGSFEKERKVMEYKIIEELATLSTDGKGRKKKLVKISWYGKEPGYEIRSFDKDGTPLKRAMLTEDEYQELAKFIIGNY